MQIIFFFKCFIYLFIETHTQREREREADTGRGRSRLHAGIPTWDSIQGLQDHTLGCRWRQTAAPPGLPAVEVFLDMVHICIQLTLSQGDFTLLYVKRPVMWVGLL